MLFLGSKIWKLSISNGIRNIDEILLFWSQEKPPDRKPLLCAKQDK
jgi:hypothetical protein